MSMRHHSYSKQAIEISKISQRWPRTVHPMSQRGKPQSRVWRPESRTPRAPPASDVSSSHTSVVVVEAPTPVPAPVPEPVKVVEQPAPPPAARAVRPPPGLSQPPPTPPAPTNVWHRPPPVHAPLAGPMSPALLPRPMPMMPAYAPPPPMPMEARMPPRPRQMQNRVSVKLSKLVAAPKEDVTVFIEGPVSMMGVESVALFTASMQKNTKFFALKCVYNDFLCEFPSCLEIIVSCQHTRRLFLNHTLWPVGGRLACFHDALSYKSLAMTPSLCLLYSFGMLLYLL